MDTTTAFSPVERACRAVTRVALGIAVGGAAMLGWPGAARADVEGWYFGQGGTPGAYFTGNVVERSDAEIDFDFGAGAPVAGIGSNDFSIIWHGEIEVPTTGPYRFQTVSDDGVRFFVDDGLIIDNWTLHGPTADNSPYVFLFAGRRYQVRMEFFERSGGAVAKLRWEGPSFGMQTVPAANLFSGQFRAVSASQNCNSTDIFIRFSRRLDQASAENPANYALSDGATVDNVQLESSGTTVRLSATGLSPIGHTITLNNIEDLVGHVIATNTQVTSEVAGNGLAATYYDQDATQRAYFTGSTVQRIDSELNFNWQDLAPTAGIGEDDFSVRWIAEVEPPTTGSYRFALRSDDGIRMWLDGNLIIDEFSDHSARIDRSATLSLNGGQRYEIIIEYYERAVYSVAQLLWGDPSGIEYVIPVDYLFPVCTAEPGAAAVGTWQFEQAAWTGAAGEVADSSGNAHDGTAVNAATTDDTNRALPGDPGTCRYTDLDRGDQQYAQVPYDGEINPDGSFTVAGWVRVTGGAGANRSMLSSLWTTSGPTRRRGYALLAGSNDRWQFRLGTGTGTVHTITGADVQNGVWTHVAATYAAVSQAGPQHNGIQRLYINGVLSSSASNRKYERNTVVDTLLGAGGLANVADEFFAGALDEINIFETALGNADVIKLMLATHPCGGGVDHYAIDHAGLAVTCEAEAVTITGHDDATPTHGVVKPGSTITISTVPPTAEIALKSGTPGNFFGGTGSAQYVFATDETAVEVWLRQTTAAVLDIDVIDTDGKSELEDESLDFRDTGWRFYADGMHNAIPTQIAGKSSSLAPGASTLTLRAVEKDADTGACAARLVPDPVAVEFAFECREPASCASPAGLSVSGTPVPGNARDAVGSYAAVPLSFAGTETATFAIDYADAGEIRLHARLLLPAVDPEPAVELLGSSNGFVVKPAGLCVEAPQAGSECATGDIACSRFRKAGAAFDFSVRGVAWEFAGEADSAFCSGNPTTPNFRLDNILLSPTRVAPAAGGSDGALVRNSLDVASGGSVTVSDQAQAEVGVFTVLATPPSYLGEAIAASRSANIGRFYPSHFVVTANAPEFAASCAGFTYQDQPFHYDTAPALTVEARNVHDAVTVNYGDDFFRLAAALPRSYTDTATASATLDDDQGGSVVITGDTDFDGIAVLALDDGSAGDTFTYRRTSAEGPFDAAVDLVFAAAGLTDADDVCYDPEIDDSCNDFAIDGIEGTELRFGRVRLVSTFGSELVPLNVPLEAQYFAGNAYVTNSADSCSLLTLAGEITLSNPQTGGGTPQPGSATMTVGAGSTAILSGDPVLAAGSANLQFAAPGSGNTGFVDITTNLGAVLPWLLFDWDGDGAFDDDSTARASFGLFPGREEMIYLREPWD